MLRLVIYGKGGIGKSTIAANLSEVWAEQGRRVLHVGCDPKHDSTVALMGGEMIPTVLDQDFGPVVTAAELIAVAPSGVHCLEAGGPQAGVGCAGRGISRTLEIMDRAGLLSPARYDVVLFDLLGDVVCGGFAAPLRHQVGEKVVIITSEEVMSLYAANNIARAVVSYAHNGIVLAGMILNLRDRDDEDLGPVERFAALLGAPILGLIRRQSLIRQAEYRRITVLRHAPQSPLAEQLRLLAAAIEARDPADCSRPTPLSDRDFYRLARSKFAAREAARTVGAGRVPGVGAGFIPARSAEPREAPPAAPQPVTEPAGAQPAAPPAEPRSEQLRRDFKRDLKAGIAAVRRGLVRPEEALARLQCSYPELTQQLQPRDLK